MISISDKESDTHKGHLYKWTNYMKGYQKRWFVLSDSSISYYRNPAEVSHTCRGTINLRNAVIKSAESCYFVVSNSGTQTFYLKAANEIEQKKWVSALYNAKERAQKRKGETVSDSDTLNNEDEDLITAITSGVEDGSKHVDMSLKKMKSCQENLNRNFSVAISKLDEMNSVLEDLEKNQDPEANQSKIEALRDRSNLFKVSMTAVMGSTKEFMSLTNDQSAVWRKIFIAKRDRQMLLEQMVEELAKQLRQLEKQVKHHSHSQQPSASSSFGKISSSRMNAPNKGYGGPGLAIPANRSSSQDHDLDSANEAFDAHSDYNLSSPNESLESNMGGRIIPPVTCNEFTDDDDDAHFFDAQETFSVTLPSQNSGSFDSLNDEKLMMPPRMYGSDEEDEISDNASLGGGDEFLIRTIPPKLREIQVIQSKPLRASTLTEGGKLDKAEILESIAEVNNSNVPSISTREVNKSVDDNYKKLETIKKRKPIQRRKVIPFRPNISLSLWSFMKNCIGKELTKIPMPVNFSEPLSMLQRLTETFEYSHLLDKAAKTSDSLLAMAYISAFAVSTYSGTAVRTNKPFNPLLGETFECDRTDDLGWRCLAEQVSHHPPVAAFYCESDTWKCWFDFSITSKFRGKYIQIFPQGLVHLYIKTTGHHYSWNKVALTVHNIIVGKLWIDNSGDIDMINHTTNEKCKLTFHPYSYFSYDTPKKVTGAITNASGEAQYILNGAWDSALEYSKVVSSSNVKSDKTVVKTGPSTSLWDVTPLPNDSSQMYNFTDFSMTLNDPVEAPDVAPTDSRLRPDQQLMENGRWNEANVVKVKLEDAQRKRRTERTANAKAITSASQREEFFLNSEDVGHKMAWFRIAHDPDSKTTYCKFTDEYWKCKEKKDWNKCIKIYDYE